MGLRGDRPGLCLLLGAALMVGGAAALIRWYLSRPDDGGGRRAAAAGCTCVRGRGEVVEDGAPVHVRGPRELYAGQEVRCTRGSAAQIELPAGGPVRVRLVLRGPGKLRLVGRGPPRPSPVRPVGRVGPGW